MTSLLHNTFDPNVKVFIVIRERVSTFAEDLLMNDSRRIEPRRRKQTTSNTTPYEDYSKTYLEWKKTSDKKNCDTSVVLGCYFVQYKSTFGEQDPEWAGKVSIKTALFNIRKMAADVTENDNYKLVEFIETMLPLWGGAMKCNLKFPTGRPTFNTFFVNRKIYAQRFALYKQWKNCKPALQE